MDADNVMQHNASPTPQGAEPGVDSKPLFDNPLAEAEDVERLREIAANLWELLDDIDTASDMFKPADEAGYRRFYEYAMKKTEARHATVTSDGYDLYLSNVAKTAARGAVTRRTVKSALRSDMARTYKGLKSSKKKGRKSSKKKR